jgi:hypothetical protein
MPPVSGSRQRFLRCGRIAQPCLAIDLAGSRTPRAIANSWVVFRMKPDIARLPQVADRLSDSDGNGV